MPMRAASIRAMRKKKWSKRFLRLTTSGGAKLFFDSVEGRGGRAIECLDRIFPILAIWYSDEKFYGCPFVNAATEDATHDKFLSGYGLRAGSSSR